MGTTGAEFTDTSGMVDTGATGTASTTGGSGVAEGSFRGAAGSKDVDNVEESGATGATGFCTTGSTTFAAGGITVFAPAGFGSPSLTTETGTPGFAAMTPGVTFAAGASTLRATGCGPDPMRSPGKRIPQKPTTHSVNSASTYPPTFRYFLDLT